MPEWESVPSVATPISADNLNLAADEAEDYADALAAGGVELGYASRTSNFTQTGAGSSDVTSLTTTVTVGSRPIIVKANADGLSNSSASGITLLVIQEDGVTIAVQTVSLSVLAELVAREVRRTPSAGSHTYKLVLTQLVTGNSTLAAGAADPAFIQVIEV